MSSGNPTLPLLSNHPSTTQPPAPSNDGLQRPGSRTPSFSSSASSLTDSPSSISTSSSPSPFHRLLPPSAVPFSWERRPGIPKSLSAVATTGGITDGYTNALLPLPPIPRSAAGIPRKNRSDAIGDPFAAALVECAKASPSASGEGIEAPNWRRPVVSGGGGGGKAEGILPGATIAFRLGLVGLFASCKSACSVSDATIGVPRPKNRATASYGPLDRRSK